MSLRWAGLTTFGKKGQEWEINKKRIPSVIAYFFRHTSYCSIPILLVANLAQWCKIVGLSDIISHNVWATVEDPKSIRNVAVNAANTLLYLEHIVS